MKDIKQLVKDYKNSNNSIDRDTVLAEVIKQVENTLKYFTLKYKNIPLDMEDIRAELLVVVYKTLDGYSEEQNCEYKTYLSRCLEQRCNKLYRDLTRDKRIAKDDNGELLYSISYDELLENGTSVSEGDCTYGDYSTVEIIELLDSLDLDSSERLICEKFSLGLKPSEIAKKLGVSPATITYKTKKIKAKMGMSLGLAY